MGVKGGGLNSQEGYGKGVILDLKSKGRHHGKMTLGWYFFL